MAMWYATRLTEKNIIFVKDVFLYGKLVEVYVGMKGGAGESRWYKVPYEKVPPTVHRFCEKSKPEVFHEEDEYGMKVIIYRK